MRFLIISLCRRSLISGDRDQLLGHHSQRMFCFSPARLLVKFGGRRVLYLVGISSWNMTSQSISIRIPYHNHLQTFIPFTHHIAKVHKYALMAYNEQSGCTLKLRSYRRIGTFGGPRYF